MEKSLKEVNRNVRIIAALYILATVTYMIGSFVLIGPIISGPNPLSKLQGQNGNNLRFGVMLHLINDAAVVGMGIFLFPILKRYNEKVALTVIVTRILEAVILIIGCIALLSLVPLRNDLDKSGLITSTYHNTVANFLTKWSATCFNMAMLCLGVGGLILSRFLYTSRLIPKALALLGIIGYPILFTKTLLNIFDLGHGALFLFIPVALFELLFPIWLLTKGFRPNRHLENINSGA